MKSRAVTAALPAPEGKIFSYLLVIRNVPKRAAHFARESKVVKTAALVQQRVERVHQKTSGRIHGGDRHVLQPSAGSEDRLPASAVGSPGCTSYHTFTASHHPEMRKEFFNA
jgi:hypothetical protein